MGVFFFNMSGKLSFCRVWGVFFFREWKNVILSCVCVCVRVLVGEGRGMRCGWPTFIQGLFFVCECVRVLCECACECVRVSVCV